MRIRGIGIRGASHIEWIVSAAILGLILALCLPNLAQARRHARAISAAGEMRALFRRMRSEAVRSRACRGILFRNGAPGWVWSIYADGDGDGIQMRDIRSGTDPLLEGPHTFRIRYPGADLAVPPFPDIPAIPPDVGPLPNPHDPVQFGPHDLVSFTPRGTCTPGTLYVSGGIRTLCAVRIHGTAGRLRVLEYRPSTRRWVIR